MLKKSGIVRKIKTQNLNYAFPQELYCMLDMYKDELKNKIKYSEYKLSPACLGIKSYIYSWNFKPGLTMECEIRDREFPNINKDYKFKYCALSVFYTNVYNESVCVYKAENSEIIQNIYIRMNKIFKEKHR